MKHLKGRDLSFSARTPPPPSDRSLPNRSYSLQPCWRRPSPASLVVGLHPPRVLNRNRKWARIPRNLRQLSPSARLSDPRPATRDSRVPGPCPACYLPLPSSRPVNSRDHVEHGEYPFHRSRCYQGLGIRGRAKAGGRGHAQGLDLLGPLVG